MPLQVLVDEILLICHMQGIFIVGCKWVYVNSELYQLDGSLEQYNNAHLVAKGFTRLCDIEYEEINIVTCSFMTYCQHL